MENVIDIQGLKKIYKTANVSTEVIKGIDLSIKKGEFVSVMGPSGSGKSTLLYLAGGLENPTEGDIKILGHEITKLNDNKMSKLRRQDIGFVFQFYNLVPHLTVVDNILLPVILDGQKKKEFIERVKHLLELVGLSDKSNHTPSQLSGGQQQRVAIARALINNPEIIFADEPIGNLDSKTGIGIMKLFEKINKAEEKTVIQVTHSLEAAGYGNRIINLKDGIIVN
ncbi:MAG: ABC transporter ATP-binding protein [Eubacteriales bacterium]